MKSTLVLVMAVACCGLAGAVSAAEKAKTPKAAKKQEGAAAVVFRVQQLHLDSNEGCAAADFDRDGKLDVSAGEFWYPGTGFTEKRALRKLAAFQKDYMTNNGEHAVDVDGDGWVDVVSGS